MKADKECIYAISGGRIVGGVRITLGYDTEMDIRWTVSAYKRASWYWGRALGGKSGPICRSWKA